MAENKRSAGRRARRTRAALVTVGVLMLATGCLPGADTDAKSGPGNNPTTGYIAGLNTNVRTAVHTEEGGFDRVVFDFLNFIPAWEVSYVDKPIRADGSGAEVPLAGDYAIKVRLSPSSEVFQTPVPPGIIDLYPGPERITTGFPQVVEVVNSGDFEGVLTWNIGTRTKAPFRVEAVTSPYRLVVDVSH